MYYIQISYSCLIYLGIHIHISRYTRNRQRMVSNASFYKCASGEIMKQSRKEIMGCAYKSTVSLN